MTFCHFFPGPEPPTDLMFSNITETSFSVSWKKPKSIVAEFKVTYTNIVTGTVNIFELSCFSAMTIKCYCVHPHNTWWFWWFYNALPFYTAGESGSLSVDSQLSHVLLSKLSVGSTYDITVSSVLETLKSEPVTASVTTGVKNAYCFLFLFTWCFGCWWCFGVTDVSFTFL